MYNLLVTGERNAWSRTTYEFDRSRFLEYTSDDIATRFKELTPDQVTVLKGIPSLFAYEGTSEPMRVGKLRNIAVNGRNVRIKFEFDEAIAPIPFELVKPLQLDLDIRAWELNRTHWAVKNENLLRHLRAAGLVPETVKVPGTAQEGPPLAPEQGVAVGSVSEFVQQVLGRGDRSKAIFYRGHADKVKYRLEPSVFRRDEKGNYKYLDAEDRLYRELLVSNSADFEGDVYTLDRLVRMQHYSLPTRLLDITSNPLMALYFACCSGMGEMKDGTYVNEIPGEVITFTMDPESIKYFDSDTVSCMANLARLTRAEKDQIKYDLQLKQFNSQPAIKRLLHFVKEEKPFFEARIRHEHLRSIICIKSKRTNDRIAVQSGAFLLFGEEAILEEEGSPQIEVSRITVKNKAAILDELDLLNINDRTVFPYIESSARYFANKLSFHG
ncbi:FRG domain-containing protein [Dyella sp. 20L07]|uniref:FRG domain-containing protein n=1 Tax=Dyella sp. 20L07 TaxID=3384240 RepID=UPI003D2C0F2D